MLQPREAPWIRATAGGPVQPSAGGECDDEIRAPPFFLYTQHAADPALFVMCGFSQNGDNLRKVLKKEAFSALPILAWFLYKTRLDGG
jgi:hypothetical protein